MRANENEENAETSTQPAATGLTPDTTEAAVKKSLQDVIHTNQLQFGPNNPRLPDVQQEIRKKQLRQHRRKQTTTIPRGPLCGRKETSTCNADKQSATFIMRWASTSPRSSSTRKTSGVTGRRHPEVSVNTKIQKSMYDRTKSKNEYGGLHAINTGKHGARQTCTSQIACNLTPS